MPALVIIGVILLIVALAVTRTLAHLIEAHAAMTLGITLAGVPVLLGASFAVFKGTMRHVIVSAPEKAPPPQLPAPAPRPEIEASHPADPFSAGALAWAQLAEEASLDDQGHRGWRPLVACEGPGCGTPVDGAPWVVSVEAAGHAEDHSFCSEECARAWQRNDHDAWSAR